MIRILKDIMEKEKGERPEAGNREARERFFRRLSDLYDFAPVGYLTLDSRGSIRESNLTAARMLGAQRPLIINRPFAVFVGRGGISRFMAHLRRLRTLEKDSSEIPLKVKGGGVIWTAIQSVPVQEEGELLLWTVLTDITARKKAEEEIERHRERLDELVEERTEEIKKINARLAGEVSAHEKAEERIKKLNDELKSNLKRLEEVNRDLEAFNFSLAHDLSTPLRIIDGFTRLLTKHYSDRLDEEARKFIETIRHNTQKMIQFIADIVHFSRLGQAGIAHVSIDMTTLARTAAAELKDSAGQGRKIIFKFHGLPPAMGEETMIRQVFMNLIGNALKFTRPRETAVIEVGGEAAGNENVCYVRDNGVGFDMANSTRLFSLFRRLHTEKEFEGTGAGLAIVQRIIERHGGRVWAEAKLGEGAAFYFTIPASREPLDGSSQYVLPPPWGKD